MVSPTAKQIKMIINKRLDTIRPFNKLGVDTTEKVDEFLGTKQRITPLMQILPRLCKQWFKEQGIQAPETITIETAEAILRTYNLSILTVIENDYSGRILFSPSGVSQTQQN